MIWVFDHPLPRWVVMWAICGFLFALFKTLTLRWANAPMASPTRKAGYCFLWPGMDATRFLGPTSSIPPTSDEWLAAGFKTAIGLGMVAISTALDFPMVTGWVAMIGMVMGLHFGMFHLLSCGWRWGGVDRHL